jgi:hypothetical protein
MKKLAYWPCSPRRSLRRSFPRPLVVPELKGKNVEITIWTRGRNRTPLGRASRRIHGANPRSGQTTCIPSERSGR